MHWPSRCATLIPCHNESDAVFSLVKVVRQALPTVIVVDDGSTDGTAAQAEAAGARVIRFSRSRGKGAALMDGFALAKQFGFSWALTMDGDGQHSPADIPEFLRRASDTGAALVVGNRFAPGFAMPAMRRIVNRTMSALLSRRLGIALPDSQCGFRLARLDEIRPEDFQTRHFEFESEMLAVFAARGLRIEFVPVASIYSTERSKIRVVPDSWRWLSWFVKSSARSKSRMRSPVRPENSSSADTETSGWPGQRRAPAGVPSYLDRKLGTRFPTPRFGAQKAAARD